MPQSPRGTGSFYPSFARKTRKTPQHGEPCNNLTVRCRLERRSAAPVRQHAPAKALRSRQERRGRQSEEFVWPAWKRRRSPGLLELPEMDRSLRRPEPCSRNNERSRLGWLTQPEWLRTVCGHVYALISWISDNCPNWLGHAILWYCEWWRSPYKHTYVANPDIPPRSNGTTTQTRGAA